MIQSHKELEVYQLSFESAMKIFRLSKKYPIEERYSLTDQIRRSSRSVCSNISEAWRKRRYIAALVAKLNDAESEAAETQTWLDFSLACSYMETDTHKALYHDYDNILGKLVIMISNPDPWALRK